MSDLPFYPPTWRCRTAVVVMAAIVGMWMVVNFDPFYLINDACQYESTAQSIRDGDGISTGCLFYGEQLYSGQVPAPQTVFPPAFPGTIALVSMAFGVELRTAAFAINLTSFLLSALVIYELCLSLGSRPIGAIVSAACWLGLGIAWHTTWWGLSEPPYILLTLLSVRLLEKRTLPWVFCAGLCAAAAISFRYAGVFFVAAAGVSYAVLLLVHRSKRVVAEALIFAFPPLLTTWLLLNRNAGLVGTMQGGNEYQLGESLHKVVMRLIASATDLVGISRSFLIVDSVAESLVILAVVVGTGLASIFMLSKAGRGQTLAFFDHPSRLLALAFLPTYTLAVLSLEYLKGSGLSDRILLPLIPFGMALVTALISQVRQTDKARAFIRATCVLAIIGFTVGQLNAHRQLWLKAPPGPELKNVLLTELESGETLESFLRDRITTEQPLLANQPQLVHGLLQRPVVGLATSRYNTGGPWTSERVESDVIDRFSVKYVLWVKGPKLVDSRTSKFFLNLGGSAVPNRLHSILQGDRFEVFEVVDPVFSSSL